MTNTTKPIISEELAKEMFKAGVHFGHKKSNRHPKMEPYIYGLKNNIYIIDLEKTIKGLQDVLNLLKKLSEKAAKFFLSAFVPNAIYWSKKLPKNAKCLMCIALDWRASDQFQNHQEKN